MALRHGVPLRYRQHILRVIAMSVLRNSKQLCACCLGEDEPPTVRTLGLVRYDRPGCQVATFTGPEPPSKTRGRRRARGDAASGSQAGQIWCGQLVGGHPRNHEADDGMEQLGPGESAPRPKPLDVHGLPTMLILEL
ncbi:hypothetical protein V8C44DRAFT_316585 [Trichoderma aethiopicum]